LHRIFFSDSDVFTTTLRSSGEDPYLGFVLIQPVVKGIQSQGVIANAKHYIDNNQEGLAGAGDRHTTSEIVDERTQMEMYYPPFGTRVPNQRAQFSKDHRCLERLFSIVPVKC
jgi:beta-glucosidase-like glycosyl hydrolase